MAVTLNDVARAAGVSIKTVSNVFNDYPHVRDETRRRVQQAIDTLGYRPNLSARGLRSGRTGAISLIIPELTNPYFAELADSVMRAADARGLTVIIEQSKGRRDLELALLQKPRTGSVDGILYSVLALGEEDRLLLNDVTTPLVLLGDRIFHGPIDHVTMRNADSTRAATAHLIARGRTRIAALGSHPGEVEGSAALRLAGYEAALEDADIPLDPDLVLPVQDWFRADGATAMRRFLNAGVEFDGVVAFNDLIGLGAMRVMQEAGLRIPQDVSVIGFDDIDETRYSLPSLSTIDPGRDEIAEVALGFLQERVALALGGTSQDIPPREHLAEFRVIARESTVTR